MLLLLVTEKVICYSNFVTSNLLLPNTDYTACAAAHTSMSVSGQFLPSKTSIISSGEIVKTSQTSRGFQLQPDELQVTVQYYKK